MSQAPHMIVTRPLPANGSQNRDWQMAELIHDMFAELSAGGMRWAEFAQDDARNELRASGWPDKPHE